MKISSSAFASNEPIPSKYTCDGLNINPPLQVSEVPGNAKSLALIVEDPDASPGVFIHWILWNINPGISNIEENSVPPGCMEGVSSFGRIGYGGPCPPSGTKHRYFFKIFALDSLLDLNPDTKARELKNIIEDHIIEIAEFIGTYKKR